MNTPRWLLRCIDSPRATMLESVPGKAVRNALIRFRGTGSTGYIVALKHLSALEPRLQDRVIDRHPAPPHGNQLGYQASQRPLTEPHIFGTTERT